MSKLLRKMGRSSHSKTLTDIGIDLPYGLCKWLGCAQCERDHPAFIAVIPTLANFTVRM